MSPQTITLLAFAAAVAVFTVTILILRRFGLPGPIFLFETIRVTRKGLHARFRVLMGLILLICLYLLYISWFPRVDPLDLTLSTTENLDLDDVANFAESFCLAFLEVQMAAVVLLTPAYTAGAITEEKQRRTLELLLAAGVSTREIVFDKMMARLLHITGILLTGLPVLALSMFFGGVDPTVMMTGYIGTFMTMFGIAGIAMACAAPAATIGKAIGMTYLIYGAPFLVGFCTCVGGLLAMPLFPFTYVALLFEADGGGPRFWSMGTFGPWGICAVNAAVHGLVGVIGMIVAVGSLRRHALGPNKWHRVIPDYPTTMRSRREGYRLEDRQPKKPKDEVVLELVEPAEGEVQLTLLEEPEPPPRPRRRQPPRPKRAFRVASAGRRFFIGDMNPLMWKEKFFGGGKVQEGPSSFLIFLIVVGAILGAVALIVMLVMLAADEPLAEFYNGLLRYPGGVFLAGLLVAVGTYIVGTISREREQQTLDGLLSLPIDRSEILWSKLWGAWYRFRWAGLIFGLLLVAGLPTEGLHPLAFLGTVLLTASAVAFAGCLALWLSVRCRTTMRAAIFWSVTMISLAAVPSLLGLVTEAMMYGVYTPSEAEHTGEVMSGLSPVVAWHSVTFTWEETRPTREEMTVDTRLAQGFLCSAMLALAAWYFWFGACRRFREEGER